MGTIAALLFWQGRRWRVPGTLVINVAATAAVWVFGIDTPTLASRYGELPRGFPVPDLRVIDPGLFLDLLPSAITVAILAGVESLLSAMVADGMARDGSHHDPDKELRGQGLANIVSPILGGIPATAAIARTGASLRNGATSRMAAVVHSAVVLTATLALGGLAGRLPLAVLAAILIVTAYNIANVPEIAKLIRAAPREDLLVLFITMSITLLFDLTYAIALGVLVSVFLLLRRLIQVPSTSEPVPNARGHIQGVSVELSDLMRSRPDIAFFNVWGVLSFYSTARFEHELGRDRRPLILRMKDVAYIDTSGLLTLEAIIEQHQRAGLLIMLTAMRPEVRQELEQFGILEAIGPENVFEHTADAIASVPPPDTAPRPAPPPVTIR